MMQRLDSAQADFDARLEGLTAWEEQLDQEVNATVAAIVADVAARGDAALLEYTARLDRLQAASVGELEVPQFVIDTDVAVDRKVFAWPRIQTGQRNPFEPW